MRFAALCSGLSHKQVQQLCKRLKVQNTVSDIAEMVSEHKASLINNDKLEAETLLTVFNKTDAWRRPERFSLFLYALLPIALQFSDTKQTGTMNSSHWSERETLITQALVAANAVDVQHIIAQGFKGPEIREALNNAKLEKISALLC